MRASMLAPALRPTAPAAPLRPQSLQAQRRLPRPVRVSEPVEPAGAEEPMIERTVATQTVSKSISDIAIM